MKPHFKTGDKVTATVEYPNSPEGKYSITGCVYYIPAHPRCLWVGKDLIVQNDEVPNWIRVRVVKRAVVAA